MWQGCFYVHINLATTTTNWAQIFTGLLFYAYVEIHQVRRLVVKRPRTSAPHFFLLSLPFLPHHLPMHVTREKIWQCFLLYSFLLVVLLPKICKTKTGIKVKLIISSPSATRGQYFSHQGWFNSLLFPNPLKGLCTFCRIKTQCLQIYTKFTVWR